MLARPFEHGLSDPSTAVRLHWRRRRGPQPRGPGPRRPSRPRPVHPAGPHPRVLGVAATPCSPSALAGSVFFVARLRLGPVEGRASTCCSTIAPFAVAAPFIGPVIDRLTGGRRWMIVGSMALRGRRCASSSSATSTSMLFYPEAFLMLVLGQGLHRSPEARSCRRRSATTQELVEANSKLSRAQRRSPPSWRPSPAPSC